MALQRTYTINLRRAILRVPRYKRAKKAVKYIKEFLTRHMKAKEVKIGQYLNYEIWKNGIKNPPTRVTVDAVKDDEGIVYVEISGMNYEETTAKRMEKVEEKKEEMKEEGSEAKTKEEEVKEESNEKKQEVKEEKKEVKKTSKKASSTKKSGAKEEKETKGSKAEKKSTSQKKGTSSKKESTKKE